jgi:class 3 adenylate cyclase
VDTRAFLSRLRRARERDAVILVGDSSGFSRRTHERGIVEALRVVAQGYDLVTPVLRRRGRIFSQKVDNVLAMFGEADDAAAAAIEIQRLLRRERTAGRTEFSICIGIDAGPVLRVGPDVYGAAVNVAAKLGEDLAGRDEILVTAEVARRLRGRRRCPYSRSTEIGGRTLEVHRLPVPR